MTAQGTATDGYARRKRSAQRNATLPERKRWAKNHPEDPRHGTPNFYSYWGCRCPYCKGAKHAARLKPLLEAALHKPTPYTVAEHRAFGEPLCFDCLRFVYTFRG